MRSLRILAIVGMIAAAGVIGFFIGQSSNKVTQVSTSTLISENRTDFGNATSLSIQTFSQAQNNFMTSSSISVVTCYTNNFSDYYNNANKSGYLGLPVICSVLNRTETYNTTETLIYYNP